MTHVLLEQTETIRGEGTWRYIFCLTHPGCDWLAQHSDLDDQIGRGAASKVRAEIRRLLSMLEEQ